MQQTTIASETPVKILALTAATKDSIPVADHTAVPEWVDRGPTVDKAAPDLDNRPIVTRGP